MKALILDFDQTLANTNELGPLRRKGKWRLVYQSLHRISLYEGIQELIIFGREKEYKIGVVTNSPRKYCELALNSLQLEVDVIIGYHDTNRRKPFPDPVLKALNSLNARSELSFGLGDTQNDILAYNRAGIRSIACLWGCNDKDSIMKCGAGFVASYPDTIYPLI